jgi:hypothetical protein
MNKPVMKQDLNTIRTKQLQIIRVRIESLYMCNQDLNVRASMTYTKAEITSGTEENEPRRQPK